METNSTGGSSKFIIGAVVIVAAIGVYAFLNSAKDGGVAMEENEGVMMKDDGVDVAMMKEYMSLRAAPLGGFSGSVAVVLTPKGEKTEVVITMVGGSAGGKHPAHIHVGACPMPGAVKYPLSPVVNGTSVTMVDASIEQLWGMLPLAINVHKSATEAKIYLACADIKNKAEANMKIGMMQKEGEAMAKEGTMMQTDTMMKVGSYEAYAPEKIAKAATGDVVLFFRASWCPTCRGLDADIKANFKNIPSDLTILDVDYDNSGDLKKKYGVTYQHTMVQVDKNGNMIHKWMGSPTLAVFVKEVK